jgi:polysaccharide biosynthesis transport protein
VETGWYESVSLSDYLGVVARRKWIVLLVTVIFTAAAVGYSKNQTPAYSATAQVLAPPNLAGANGSGNAASEWATNHAAVAASATTAPLILGKPYAAPHLDAKGVPTASPATRLAGSVPGAKLAPAELLNQTTVAVDTVNPDAIDFTVSAEDPTLAAQLANAWAQGYADYFTRQPGIKSVSQYHEIDVRLHPNGPTSTSNLPDSTKTNLGDKQTNLQAGLVTNNPPLETSEAVSANQTQPQTARNTVIGFVLGLLLGVILAFVQDLLDKRIGTAAEVGRRLRVPLLAAIPSPPRALRDHPLVLLAPRGGAQAPSAEAYRIAKLNLGNLIHSRHVRTIMFTAAGDREGTSSSAANLAIAFARSGQHVILVDANMRRPAADRFFGLDDRAGLSDILSGRAALADALTALDVSPSHPSDPTRNGGGGAPAGLLEVLPAGAPPDDPADLLDTRTMTELLAELRSRADVVLVDVPPILPVTDAMLVGTKVDGVVAVARSRLASRPHMVALARALESCAAPVLGFLFTGAPVGEDHEYGGLVGASMVPSPQTAAATRQREREPLP